MARAWVAAAGYLAVALVMTWPLALGLGRDVAWDLGDSLLNMWILAWDSEQLRLILGGDLVRLRTFFDANIFYPEPLALAYSEHLFAQAVQILPLYLLTGNPILVYNLLFLSTFVLSGFGCYLLVRELTGNPLAAFLAGLLFAFAPYRIPQFSHLQVLSVQWMPLALYGFRRYFAHGSRRALAGGALAVVAQNLSSGYYLLYFAPFVLLYVVWEMQVRRLWRDRRTWIEVIVAAVIVVAVTAPFLVPYAAVRARLGLARDVSEVVRFSADVYSYFTASPAQRVWADIAQARPKPEGELFPGAVPLVLALCGVVLWVARARRAASSSAEALLHTESDAWRGASPLDVARGALSDSRRAALRRTALAIAIAIASLYAVLLLVIVLLRRVDFSWAFITIRVSDGTRLLIVFAAAVAAWLWLSPRARARASAALAAPEAFFVVALVLAWWLSLGPSPRTMGRTLEAWAPYALLYDYVPGFDGVRVPARFAMIVALMLAVLAGFAAAALPPRRRPAIIGVLALVFLVESHALPFVVNGSEPLRDFVTPEPRVYRPARAPRVYHAIRDTPADAVLVEIPLGDADYDVRATYYSTVHWRRLVNGYSGYFPLHYRRLTALLRDVTRQDEVAWAALSATGATHVLVHEGAYLDDEGRLFVAWLRGRGAVEVFRDGGDVLFILSR